MQVSILTKWTIEDLPNELLLFIFTLVQDYKTIGMISQVSRRWNLLSSLPCIQRHPAFKVPIRFSKYTSQQLIPDTKIQCETSVNVIASDLTNDYLYVGDGSNILVLSESTGATVRVLKGHTDQVSVLSLGQSGMLYSGSYDKTIRIWNDEGKCVSTLECPATVRALAVSSINKKLYSGGHDKVIRVWPLDESGIVDHDAAGVKVITGHTSGVYAIAVAPDGKTFYSGAGSKDANIRVWTAEGDMVTKLEGHKGGIYSLETDVEGNLYSASADKLLMMWSPQGTLLRKFRGHRKDVNTVVVAKDTVFTGSNDKTIRVWDRRTGKQLHTFSHHSHPVQALALSHNGRLYSGSQDKSVLHW